MKKCNVIFRFFLLMLLTGGAEIIFAQANRKDLEAQRIALEKQIKSTTDILQKTQKSKTKSIHQLRTLNAQIQQRQALLNSIVSEIKQVDQEAGVQEKNAQAAEQSMKQLEARMELALRTAYIRSRLQPDWMYLLSASSLSQAMIRWVYLRQYKDFIQRQVNALHQKREQHRMLQNQLQESKRAKTELLETEQKNKQAIQSEQKSQEALLRDLGREEKKLKSALTESQNKKKKLDAEISRLISAETTKVTSSGLKEAPETKALNDQFSANKGKLPWPVSKGLVTEKFGTHPHPVLKGITVQNNGVDIRSEPGMSVKSLFNGTVASVTKIPGYDYMVMVRHGLYFTVYSRLMSVSVKKGDNVTTGQVLGSLGQDEPELHLEIWQDKTKLNPESWMARR